MLPDVNYIQISFSLLTSSMIILGSLMNTFEKYLPLCMRQTFRYGKFALQGKPTFIKHFEVPKSSFKQFYEVASVIYTFFFVQVIAAYVFNHSVPEWIISLLDVICGSNRFATTSPASVLVAVILITLQCYRRFYDTHFVSIFSKSGRINIIHYVIGLLYYPACMIAVLGEAPKFSHFSKKATLQMSDLSYLDFWAIGLFVWAWWHQHVASVILANLRRNKKGVIVTEEHRLPQGDWFDYLSSPHQVAEILMYFSLSIILRYNITWMFIFAWVLSNQVETCILSHEWYKDTFEDFPKERKALIPFVY